ncbi:hypothetical protein BBF96_13125 [Anoxybacter fermentans]|uniref:Uncharacterized protein n=1 Tax=Anoxybacter fermentans TaxID=1323375 RepID=A0A3Q9HS24_9FIRM|nr:hypothetical protein [Anoxybacter fermentans]AZR74259.1 hypothetical protein BBF96_13125 [Anoxybacter fermentans]
MNDINKLAYFHRLSITIKDNKGKEFFGYLEGVSPDYLIIRGISRVKYTPLYTSFILYYFNYSNEIVTQCFKNLILDSPELIGPEIYKLKIKQLTEEQRNFLNNFTFYTKDSIKKIHISNQLDLSFELAFNLVNPKLEDLLNIYAVRDIFEFIKEKMALENTLIGKLKLNRVYYGHEFCPRLLPSTEKLEYILRKVKDEKLELTFVTPTLYQKYERQFEILFDFIDHWGQRHGKVIEVVFNNWGTFQLLKGKKFIKPVLGRLLVKMKRDPRYSYEKNEIFKRCKDNFRYGDLSVHVYQKFLYTQGIEQVEIDCLPQGFPLDLSKGNSIKLHLHFPFYTIAFSRMCLLGVLDRDFKTLHSFQQPCNYNCRDYSYEVDFLDKVRVKEDLGAVRSKSLIKGRGFFSQFHNWKSNFDFALAHNKNINRLIFYHEMPY